MIAGEWVIDAIGNDYRAGLLLDEEYALLLRMMTDDDYVVTDYQSRWIDRIIARVSAGVEVSPMLAEYDVLGDFLVDAKFRRWMQSRTSG